MFEQTLDKVSREWLAEERAAKLTHRRRNVRDGTCWCGLNPAHFFGVPTVVASLLAGDHLTGDWRPSYGVASEVTAELVRHWCRQCSTQPPEGLVKRLVEISQQAAGMLS